MAPFHYKNEYERYRRYYQSLGPKLDKPANRAYTAIIFSFLAVSLFSWYAIRPTMQTIFTLKREIQDKTDIDKKMENKISALIEAQAVYQEMESGIPLIAQALPPLTDPIGGISQLRNLAHQANVTLTSVNVPPLSLTNEKPQGSQKVPLTNKLSEFMISISVVGTYAHIKEFIQGIIDMRRITQIESMTFIPQKELPTGASPSANLSPTTSTHVQLNLKLKLFYLST